MSFDFNDMTEALMIQTIRIAHYANGARPRITVLDEQADETATAGPVSAK